MTEDEMMHIATTMAGRDALAALAKVPQAERRKHKKAVMALFKARDPWRWQSTPAEDAPEVADDEAVNVAMLSVATLSDLKAMNYFPRWEKIKLEEIIAALRPDWTQGLVEHLVADNPNFISRLAPIWQQGLCDRPEGDEIILGYYAYAGWPGAGQGETDLLERDIWRFFEVEGGGEFSLANHDKFVKSETNSWSARMLRYVEKGKLDRQRLLDASLDALDRDFGQYAAGWYSRFHVTLDPTPEERAARAGRYLALLGSQVPPTVSFAMKQVQALEKAGALGGGALLDGLEPALQARAKGVVTAALGLLKTAAKRDAALRPRAAEMALLALVSEDAGVQGKALDLFEALGGANDAALRAELSEHGPLVAPSLRARVAALSGAEVETEEAPLPVAEGPEVLPVVPAADAEEALTLALAALEDPRDPFEVERAVDGLSRFGAELAEEEARLSPLLKRARQVAQNYGDVELRLVMAVTARALTEAITLTGLHREAGDQAPALFRDRAALQSVHLARNLEMAARVRRGVSLPLLSLPSDTRGMIRAGDLRARLAAYAATGETPGVTDMSLALMRLDPGSTSEGIDTATEAGRALAYATGQAVEVGPGTVSTPGLWACAWRARAGSGGGDADPAITALFDTPQPDCGTPAQMPLEVWCETSDSGEFRWIRVSVPVTPPRTGTTPALPALFHAPHRKGYFLEGCCGYTYADIAWGALTRPADPEPFFRQAILQQDHYQKLSDNPTRAYLDPVFRPGPPLGPLGAATLVYYMAVEDKSVTGLAAEGAALALGQGRLGVEGFAGALRAFLLSQSLPTARWTKALAIMAEQGAAGEVRATLERVFDFPPEACPRDVGGMLELWYELCVAAGDAPRRPETLDCLAALPGGGKVRTFSGKLLKLAG